MLFKNSIFMYYIIFRKRWQYVGTIVALHNLQIDVAVILSVNFNFTRQVLFDENIATKEEWESSFSRSDLR